MRHAGIPNKRAPRHAWRLRNAISAPVSCELLHWSCCLVRRTFCGAVSQMFHVLYHRPPLHDKIISFLVYQLVQPPHSYFSAIALSATGQPSDCIAPHAAQENRKRARQGAWRQGEGALQVTAALLLTVAHSAQQIESALKAEDKALTTIHLALSKQLTRLQVGRVAVCAQEGRNNRRFPGRPPATQSVCPSEYRWRSSCLCRCCSRQSRMNSGRGSRREQRIGPRRPRKGRQPRQLARSRHEGLLVPGQHSPAAAQGPEMHACTLVIHSRCSSASLCALPRPLPR